MTRAQAWRRIAAVYEKKIATGLPVRGNNPGQFGLCHAVRVLGPHKHRWEMLDQIDGALEDRGGNRGYLWQYDKEGDELRAILAGLFAAEADD